MARSYDQYCGLAAALDVLGERWTLLILRDLSLGPKRYRDLLDVLPGIGTNLLAARLKSLEEAGVVRRVALAPPAGVQVYELTARGEALRPAIESLALWGLELLPEEIGARRFRPAWAASCMRAGADPDAVDGLRATFLFDVAGEQFHVTAADGALTVADGPPAGSPDVVVACDVQTYLAVGARRKAPAEAVAAGGMTIEGKAALLDELLAAFHLPAREGAARVGGR